MDGLRKFLFINDQKRLRADAPPATLRNSCGPGGGRGVGRGHLDGFVVELLPEQHTEHLLWGPKIELILAPSFSFRRQLRRLSGIQAVASGSCCITSMAASTILMCVRSDRHSQSSSIEMANSERLHRSKKLRATQEYSRFHGPSRLFAPRSPGEPPPFSGGTHSVLKPCVAP